MTDDSPLITEQKKKAKSNETQSSEEIHDMTEEVKEDIKKEEKEKTKNSTFRGP